MRSAVVTAAASRAQQQADPHGVLGVPRGASRRAIRAAYIERIKLLHPDVSASGEDTTLEAAAVNAAYEALMQGGRGGGPQASNAARRRAAQHSWMHAAVAQ